MTHEREFISLLVRDGRVVRRIEGPGGPYGFTYFNFEKANGFFVRCEWELYHYYLLHYPSHGPIDYQIIKLWKFVRAETTNMPYDEPIV